MSEAAELESALRTKRQAQALLIQRKQRMSALVAKRRMNLTYLQNAHLGGTFWLNCTLLSVYDIQQYAQSVPRQRALAFFYLSLSLSKLLDASPQLSSGAPLVRALVQLFEELDYHFAGAALQGVKFMTAKMSPCIYPMYNNNSSPRSPPTPTQSLSQQGSTPTTPLSLPDTLPTATASALPPGDPLSSDDAPFHSSASTATPTTPAPTPAAAVKISATIYRFGNAVVYQHLLVPHMPFEALDYCEVFVSLCSALSAAYDSLSHSADCYTTTSVYDAVLRLDGRVKQLVISLATKELTEFCLSATSGMLEQLRTEAPPSFSSR